MASSVPESYYEQSAVVPYREGRQGLEVLLITTIRKKRWIIPKGIVEPGLGPALSAAQEAFEEAGVRGDVHSERLGRYTYAKWGGMCAVDVFGMRVTEVLDDWLEADVRSRAWFRIEDAVERVDEPALRPVLQHFSDWLARR